MRTLMEGGTSGAPREVHRHAPQSPWHSPVPYLFGGLAAMLGLIAFALLVLACSYWKLSGYLDPHEEAEDTEKCGGEVIKPPPMYEEKVVVIMAGEVRPTFIATPVLSQASSFNDDEKRKAVEEGGEEATKQGVHTDAVG